MQNAQSTTAWASKVSYVALAKPNAVVDYAQYDLVRIAFWSGRLVVWDLARNAWLGGVNVRVRAARSSS